MGVADILGILCPCCQGQASTDQKQAGYDNPLYSRNPLNNAVTLSSLRNADDDHGKKPNGETPWQISGSVESNEGGYFSGQPWEMQPGAGNPALSPEGQGGYFQNPLFAGSGLPSTVGRQNSMDLYVDHSPLGWPDGGVLTLQGVTTGDSEDTAPRSSTTRGVRWADQETGQSPSMTIIEDDDEDDFVGPPVRRKSDNQLPEIILRPPVEEEDAYMRPSDLIGQPEQGLGSVQAEADTSGVVILGVTTSESNDDVQTQKSTPGQDPEEEPVFMDMTLTLNNNLQKGNNKDSDSDSLDKIGAFNPESEVNPIYGNLQLIMNDDQTNQVNANNSAGEKEQNGVAGVSWNLGTLEKNINELDQLPKKKEKKEKKKKRISAVGATGGFDNPLYGDDFLEKSGVTNDNQTLEPSSQGQQTLLALAADTNYTLTDDGDAVVDTSISFC